VSRERREGPVGRSEHTIRRHAETGLAWHTGEHPLVAAGEVNNVMEVLAADWTRETQRNARRHNITVPGVAYRKLVDIEVDLVKNLSPVLR
jgi:hypothetical protein